MGWKLIDFFSVGYVEPESNKKERRRQFKRLLLKFRQEIVSLGKLKGMVRGRREIAIWIDG